MIEIHHTNGTVLYTAQDATDVRSALEAAVKSRANLVGAYLVGAYLADANLAGANLACANLVGANLAGANLACAYLVGANLADAYLVGANLAGAYLVGAVTGCLLGYGWSLYRGRFRYGCEEHELGDWTDRFIEERCKHHVGINAAKYAAALKGLVAWLRTLDLEVTP